MKYTINYILSGGSTMATSIDDLPIAFSIYEFKSSIILLPKAIDQNLKNIGFCTTGAYHKEDKSQIKRFKTDSTTKKIILINDSNNTQFNGLFMNPKDIHRKMDDLIRNYKIQDIEKLIKKNLNNIYELIQHDEYNIYVIDIDKSIQKIKDSNLFNKFNIYRTTFNDISTSKIADFLIVGLKDDPKKAEYIENYKLLLRLEKEIKYSEFIKNLLEKKTNFKYKTKFFSYDNILKVYDDLSDTEKRGFNREFDKFKDIKAKDKRSIIDIYNQLEEYKSNSGAIGNQIGNNFEKEVETTQDLRDELIRKVDGLKPGSYTSYFNHTGGISDVDMAVVINK